MNMFKAHSFKRTIKQNHCKGLKDCLHPWKMGIEKLRWS